MIMLLLLLLLLLELAEFIADVESDRFDWAIMVGVITVLGGHRWEIRFREDLPPFFGLSGEFFGEIKYDNQWPLEIPFSFSSTVLLKMNEQNLLCSIFS